MGAIVNNIVQIWQDSEATYALYVPGCPAMASTDDRVVLVWYWSGTGLVLQTTVHWLLPAKWKPNHIDPVNAELQFRKLLDFISVLN